jgi:hypothetical protein
LFYSLKTAQSGGRNAVERFFTNSADKESISAYDKILDELVADLTVSKLITYPPKCLIDVRCNSKLQLCHKTTFTVLDVEAKLEEVTSELKVHLFSHLLFFLV